MIRTRIQNIGGPFPGVGSAPTMVHDKWLPKDGSASDYKKSPKAKNWVGSAVAYAVGLDLDDNVQRKRASSLVTALMREGALVEREERDPVRRELTVFVRAA